MGMVPAPGPSPPNGITEGTRHEVIWPSWQAPDLAMMISGYALPPTNVDW
jgi:hypothetical protein